MSQQKRFSEYRFRSGRLLWASAFIVGLTVAGTYWTARVIGSSTVTRLKHDRISTASPAGAVLAAMSTTEAADVGTTRVEPANAESRQVISEGLSLRLAIDGSKTPDLIPDDLAYRHLLDALALQSVPAAEDLAKHTALRRKLGLSEASASRFTGVMLGLRNQLDAIDTAHKALVPGPPENNRALDNLRARRKAVLDNAARLVRNSLDTDGQIALHRFVTVHVKRNIVIFGDPVIQ